MFRCCCQTLVTNKNTQHSTPTPPITNPSWSIHNVNPRFPIILWKNVTRHWIERDGNQRDIVFHYSSIFLLLPFSPPPPIFPSFFSITYYLFCIDTFLSLCLEKGIFMIMNNSHFSMRKIFSFSFFFFSRFLLWKTLGNKRKSISPSECICICVTVHKTYCANFSWKGKPFFLYFQ